MLIDVDVWDAIDLEEEISPIVVGTLHVHVV